MVLAPRRNGMPPATRRAEILCSAGRQPPSRDLVPGYLLERGGAPSRDLVPAHLPERRRAPSRDPVSRHPPAVALAMRASIDVAMAASRKGTADQIFGRPLFSEVVRRSLGAVHRRRHHEPAPASIAARTRRDPDRRPAPAPAHGTARHGASPWPAEQGRFTMASRTRRPTAWQRGSHLQCTASIRSALADPCASPSRRPLARSERWSDCDPLPDPIGRSHHAVALLLGLPTGLDTACGNLSAGIRDADVVGLPIDPPGQRVGSACAGESWPRASHGPAGAVPPR